MQEGNENSPSDNGLKRVPILSTRSILNSLDNELLQRIAHTFHIQIVFYLACNIIHYYFIVLLYINLIFFFQFYSSRVQKKISILNFFVFIEN